ncbi:MAG: type IV secretory system conjugative DNA transfer family protein [Rhodospirillaceae bacterium]|nr:type IV secretory system conjugative DNA transfer family protein [Rhodospirillaceae bacterium]
MKRRRDNDRRRRLLQRDPGLHGTSQWGGQVHLAERGYGPGQRLTVGYAPPEVAGRGALSVGYGGSRHLLTVAPNRAGKGVSSIIPALLTHPGPAIVIDPDGDATVATARYRERVLGHNVQVYDPYDKVCHVLGRKPARFNPVGQLDPASPIFYDDTMLIAEAATIRETYGSRFWSDEGLALNGGFTMQVRTDPREAGDRTMGRMRDILSLPIWEFRDYVGGKVEEDPVTGKKVLVSPGMLQSRNRYVRAAAGRILSKPERQFGDVLSTAQQNTHFLESDVIRRSLAASDFAFAEIGTGRFTLYIVLPRGRLRTQGRLLRLLVSLAIDAVAALPVKPDPPCLFILDEMAAMGPLDPVIDAFGLLAGTGLQLWPIFQDLSQAKAIYGDRWQTFIANAAVVQAFGTRDLFTADYISKLCGVGSVEHLTHESALRREHLLGDPDYFSREDQLAARPLITPDEMMTLHPALQVLVLANAHPVMGYRAPYFLDARFRDRAGRPLFDTPPQHRGRPLPPPLDFTRPHADLLAALAPYASVG